MGVIDTALPVRAAIFDCDGILVDSERPWLDLMAFHLERLGADRAAAESFRGLTAAEAVARLDAVRTGTAPVPAVAEVDRAYSAALTAVSAPMPGVPELVRALSGTVPIAVASNGRRADVRGLLDRTGLLPHFDEVVTIDDVARGKPFPDIYEQAARALGLTPAAAVAFEDSRVGSQAAHTAGCTVIGVNADPSVALVSAVRLADLTQLRFDPATSTLHLDSRRGDDR